MRQAIDADVSRLDASLTDLAQAQTRTEQRMDELAQAQKETQLELKLLVKVVTRQSDRLDVSIGRTLEIDFRDRLGSQLWRVLKQARLVTLAELADPLEAALDETELQDLSRADAIAAGLVEGKPAYVVAEVSSTADSNDVRRAARWARLFEKAGLHAMALVACDHISDRTHRFAEKKQIGRAHV